MLIWVLASQLDNSIPNDPVYLQRMTGVSEPPDIKLLIALGFLVPVADCSHDASAPLASCTPLSHIRETETEAEKEDDVARGREELRDTHPLIQSMQVHPMRELVRQHIIARLPHLARRNASEIDRWLRDGADPEKDIYPTVEHLIGIKGADIGSFEFFTRSITSSAAARKEQDEVFKRLAEKELAHAEPR